MCLLYTMLLVASDIRIEKVFGPEIPGKYKHPASLTQLANGDLLLAYFGGSGEYAADTAVHLTGQAKAGGPWSAPKKVSDRPKLPEGNPVIWQAPDDLVWLFLVVRHGETWSTSTIQARTSADGGETWSDPMPLTTEKGTMVRGAPIILPDGGYLLPAYHETGNDRERTGADSTSFFLIRDPRTGRWSETNRIRSRQGNIQPSPAVVEGNHLVAYCRRGGGYGPVTDGYLVRSESVDGGRTWSPGKDSAFKNPNAAVDFLRLRNGHLLLVFNDSMNQRTPLTAAISTDGDRTYPYRRNLVDGPGDFGYPYAIQTADGKIHVVYTSDRRSTIRHAVFEEDAIVRPGTGSPN